ncbi:MAG: hypothetical protein U0169_22985 [Polyangiaceae bacterium]
MTTVEGYDFVPSLAWDGQKAFATFRMNPVRYGQTQVMAIHVEADGSPTEATPVLVAGLAPGFASFPPATVWMNDDATFLFVDSKTTQTSPGAYDNALLDDLARSLGPPARHDGPARESRGVARSLPRARGGPRRGPPRPREERGDIRCLRGFLALRLVTSGSPIGAACSAHEDCRLRNCVDGYCCNEACGDVPDLQRHAGDAHRRHVGDGPAHVLGDVELRSDGNGCKAERRPRVFGGRRVSLGTLRGRRVLRHGMPGILRRLRPRGFGGRVFGRAGRTSQDAGLFPATCDGTRPNCPGNCTTDADCAADGFCSKNGLREIRRSNGQTCNDNACQIPGCRQCTSGHCVDGYCCDGACSGACDSCSKVPGTCQRASRGERANPSCSPFSARAPPTRAPPDARTPRSA